MLQIKPMTIKDEAQVMEMVRDFYHSDAVGSRSRRSGCCTEPFLDAVGQEPSLWGLVLWDGGQAVGFSYLTSFLRLRVRGKDPDD